MRPDDHGARLQVDVLGVPAPQGSKTAVMRNGKAAVIEGGSATGRARHRAWRSTVAIEARAAWGARGPLDGPVEVVVVFWMPRPAAARKRQVWAHRRPDLDKLLRSTLDALTDAGVVADDARVVRIVAEKRLSESWVGASIEVGLIDPEQ